MGRHVLCLSLSFVSVSVHSPLPPARAPRSGAASRVHGVQKVHRVHRVSSGEQEGEPPRSG